MSGKTALLGFDAFSKTAEDRRVRTSMGGLITIGCLITTCLLLWIEWGEYNSIVLRPELVVDKASNEKLKINLDVSFPNIPCDMLTLDVMDMTGDISLDVLNNGFVKIRLDPNGQELDQGQQLVYRPDYNSIIGTADGQCGSCYGAQNQNLNSQKPDSEKICCNTCESVKFAYGLVAWKFFDGADIEQCEREGYVESINKRLDEGCRVKGVSLINRMGGNIHFAPGMSMSYNDRHIHDLSLYEKEKDRFSFQHTIHHFSFGEDSHEDSLIFASDSHDHTTSHPLDEMTKTNTEKWTLFSYFLKVVNTRFEYLDGKSIEANEFSVTQHERPVIGGRDADHPHTLHGRGGLPGVFFYFDISPLKIINREAYKKSFGGFLLSFFSALAGVLSVGAILDRVAFTARRFLKEKKAI